MRASLARALVLILPVVLPGCRDRPPAPDVLAQSTLGETRRSDLDAYILSLPEKRRGPGPGEEPKAWRRSLLEEMLVSRTLEADGLKNRVLDRPEARALLDDQVESLLVEEVKSRRLAQVKVTDADVRAFYDSHPKEVSHSGQIRLRHIFKRVPRDASPEVREAARAEMQDLLRQIRDGVNFEEMARLHSDSETGAQGGLIGRLNRGNLGRSVEAIVWKLKEGEISGVVGTPVGFHIFKLDNHIPPFRMDFAEALPRLRKRLTLEATERALEEQVRELAAAAGATYDPKAAWSGEPGAIVYALGDDRVTREDWEKAFWAKSFPQQRETPTADQVDEFVGTRLRLWEARRQGIDKEPAIAERIVNVRRAVLIRFARQDRLVKAVEGTEAEMKAFYAANTARFMTPKLHHLRLITLPFPESGVDYGVYERLEALASEIRAGRRAFADVAREVSSDVTASRGGDAGFVRLDLVGEWAGPRARTHVEKVGVGQVSEPILVERYDKTLLKYHREGYMLVLVEEVRESRARPFEEVRDEVREEYAAREMTKIQKRFREQVLGSIRARIYDQSL